MFWASEGNNRNRTLECIVTLSGSCKNSTITDVIIMHASSIFFVCFFSFVYLTIRIDATSFPWFNYVFLYMTLLHSRTVVIYFVCDNNISKLCRNFKVEIVDYSGVLRLSKARDLLGCFTIFHKCKLF